MRQRVVLLLAAVLVTTVAALPIAGAAQPRPSDPPAVERFDQVTDCWALRTRYSQAHTIWRASVRAGAEDHAAIQRGIHPRDWTFSNIERMSEVDGERAAVAGKDA